MATKAVSGLGPVSVGCFASFRNWAFTSGLAPQKKNRMANVENSPECSRIDCVDERHDDAHGHGLAIFFCWLEPPRAEGLQSR